MSWGPVGHPSCLCGVCDKANAVTEWFFGYEGVCQNVRVMGHSKKNSISNVKYFLYLYNADSLANLFTEFRSVLCFVQILIINFGHHKSRWPRLLFPAESTKISLQQLFGTGKAGKSACQQTWKYGQQPEWQQLQPRLTCLRQYVHGSWPKNLATHWAAFKISISFMLWFCGKSNGASGMSEWLSMSGKFVGDCSNASSKS